MEQSKPHWASELEVGDRVRVTIRHINDGSKNLIKVPCIVIEQIHSIKSVKVAHEENVYTIPYNEFSPF